MSIPIPINGLSGASESTWSAADSRRKAQLVLAAIWLLDGVLQYQPFMFTKGFGSQMLASVAQGNPAVIADPITWAARIVTDHPVGTNAAFATFQLLLGLALAWRPTVRAALAASVGWSVAVWWLGEGLGGVMTGSADPLSGAPGAVILYALIAVLVWPVRRSGDDFDGPFPAARPVGVATARGLWFVLWGSLAYFAMQSANTGSQAMHDMIAGMAQGGPGWLASIDNHAAGLVADRGLAASIVLAVVFAVVAFGVFLPERFAGVRRATLVLAVVVSAVIWVVGEAMGGLFGGQGTDPNSGPLLALLVFVYWPGKAAGSGSADVTGQ